MSEHKNGDFGDGNIVQRPIERTPFSFFCADGWCCLFGLGYEWGIVRDDTSVAEAQPLPLSHSFVSLTIFLLKTIFPFSESVPPQVAMKHRYKAVASEVQWV